MQKYFFYLISLVLLALTLQNCKAKTSAVATDVPNGQVALVLSVGATPESIVETAPFEVLKEQLINKKTNEWLVTYDLKKYSRQELTGYLINLANVISVDGVLKDVSPPIQGRTKEEIPTKKQ